jgi:photosystem II S4 domain protein
MVRNVLPHDKLIKSLQYFKVDKDLSQQLVEHAENSIRSWSMEATPFLTQPQQKAVSESFKDIVDLKFTFFGGYPQAEQRRAVFQRSEGESYEADTESSKDESVIDLAADDFVALLNIEGNFLFEKATHDDFRNAVIQVLGSDKGQVGDVIVTGDRGAQVLMQPECCELVCRGLKQVCSVPVDVGRVELTDLKVRPQSVKELSTVEASLRLDAVASAGFGYSRTKMVSLVESGSVTVDWKPVSNPAVALQIGQEVSVRGVGRLIIEDAQMTSKGRYKVKMKKIT